MHALHNAPSQVFVLRDPTTVFHEHGPIARNVALSWVDFCSLDRCGHWLLPALQCCHYLLVFPIEQRRGRNLILPACHSSGGNAPFLSLGGVASACRARDAIGGLGHKRYCAYGLREGR
jgi:hypothetical protein